MDKKDACLGGQFSGAGQGNKHPAIPEGVFLRLTKLDGALMRKVGEKDGVVPYRTALVRDSVFLGNRFDVVNNVLSVVAYDPENLYFRTYVAVLPPNSAGNICAQLEQAGFTRGGLDVPHVYTAEVFFAGKEDPTFQEIRRKNAASQEAPVPSGP